MDYVAISMEVVWENLDTPHIVELAATKVSCGKVIDNFYTLVSCPFSIPKEDDKRYVNIYDEQLVGAPNIKEALSAFFSFCKGHTLAGYFLPLDLEVLTYNAKKYGVDLNWDVQRYDDLCSQNIYVYSLVRKKLKRQLKIEALPFVAHHLGITDCYRNDSLACAIQTAKIYEKLRGIDDVGFVS